MTVAKKEIENLIDKYTHIINYIDSQKNPEEYGRFEVDVLDEVIEDLQNLIKTKNGLKEVLENTAETKEYLSKLKKVYMICCWASYGVREYPFSGKYANKDKTEPLVYDYDDHNGTCDNYFLKNLYDTTTGHIWGWTWNKEEAERIANNLEEKRAANS